MAVRLTLDTSVKYIKGIGDARAAAFSRLGIETVGDLLTFYPRTYEERGRIVKIADAMNGETCALEITVLQTGAPKYIRGNLNVFRSIVSDGSGTMDLVFFNTPFMARSLPAGRRFRVYGRMKITAKGREMVSPKLEPIIDGKALPYYVPVYKLALPLTQKTIASAVSEVLHLCDSLEEILPEGLIGEMGLLPRREAVKAMHKPQTQRELALARRSLAFSELAVFRIALARMRKNIHRGNAFSLGMKNTGIKSFFEKMPFELTNAQKRAVKEIFADLEKDSPMARLLQGDVGSGKTAVAAAAIYLCVKNGCQACLMAPTEILAAQHKKTMEGFLSPFGIKTELLVSGMPAAEKRRVREGIKDGSVHLAVGTHALITDNTEFNKCALAVVDEQHRFGVKQRAAVLQKSEFEGNRAHMLVMSATPIPRSLSLIIFGDLDVSLLDELPPGRQKIETKVVSGDEVEKVYGFIRKEVEAGGRAYVVCPLIEESENDDDRQAAESYYKELTENSLKGIPAGLLHGKMKQAEKAKVMEDFASGKTKILVATTVIEVGVDVPEATVMVIENAENFGLSQLHQLRGRIGRGKKRSVCILINRKDGIDGIERLRIMRDTSDGFKVAEADLERRGPGDFFGERQSGEFSFACASISDISLLGETDALVKKILEDKDNPQYKAVFDAADKFLERTGGGLTVN